MIDSLSCDHFEPHVGESFELADRPGGVSLKLSRVRPLGQSPRQGGGFALDFDGPATPALPQAIYALRHAKLGTLEIFIVPVGREKDAMRYEAIFT